MRDIHNGMYGALQVFENMLCPSRDVLKKRARKYIEEHKICVKVNANLGRKYRGAYWLNKAAACRIRAMGAQND